MVEVRWKELCGRCDDFWCRVTFAMQSMSLESVFGGLSQCYRCKCLREEQRDENINVGFVIADWHKDAALFVSFLMRNSLSGSFSFTGIKTTLCNRCGFLRLCKSKNRNIFTLSVMYWHERCYCLKVWADNTSWTIFWGGPAAEFLLPVICSANF